MNRQRIISLVAGFVSILGTFLVLEFALRVGYPLYRSYNSEMWRYGRFLKVISDDPQIGHEHRPSSEGDFYGVHIKTNSEGWRDREYSLIPPADKRRVMVLGDSLTLGWGVNHEDAYPRILENLLTQSSQPTEVINTGVGNYNTIMEVKSYAKKGEKYRPDAIVVGFYINDAEVIQHRQSALTYQLQHTYLYSLLADRWLNLKVRLTPTLHYKDFYSKLYEPGFPGRSAIADAFTELSDRAREMRIPVHVALIPEMHQFKDYPFQAAHDFVIEACRMNQLDVVDLLPYFINENPDSLWVSSEDAHPNRRGQEIIAKGIFESFFKKSKPSQRQLASKVEGKS